MAGTALENNSAPASPVSNGTPQKLRKSQFTASPNGLRRGFLDNHCSPTSKLDVADVVQLEAIEHTPLFSKAVAPERKTASTTSITLQLEAVAQTGLSHPLPEGAVATPCIINYVVEMQQVETRSSATGIELAKMCKVDKWTEVYRGLELLTEVHGLKPGRRYAFRMLCCPVASPPLTQPPLQTPSPPTAVATPAREPDAPAAPTLSARARTSLTFKWREPEDTGGRDIHSYFLQMKPPAGDPQEVDLDEGFCELYVGLDLRYKAIRLSPGHEYRARVKAKNIIGESPWSQEACFTTQATLPAPPEGLRCTANGPDSVFVTWQIPRDGGAPIFAYQLQRAAIDSADYQPVYKGQETHCTVTGLESGQAYKFRVLAENEEGKGPFSSIIEIQTAAVPPDSPSVPSTMGSNRTSVSIRWDAPLNDGGDAISNYEVELRPKSRLALEGISNEWIIVYQGKAPSCTMGCLVAGCTYQVRIRAQNSSGWGQYCLPTEVKSAPGVPHAPGAPKGASCSHACIELEWEASLHDGGSGVTSYRLEMSSGASASDFKTVLIQPAQQGCHAEVTDLEPGAEYSFQVYAVNSQGASPASATGTLSTRPAPPLAPDAPKASAISSCSFKLSWSPPSAQGAAVTGYSVSVEPAGAFASPARLASANVPSEHSLTNGYSNGVHPLQTGSDPPIDAPPANGILPNKRQRRLIPVKGTRPAAVVSDLQPFTEYSCQVKAGNSAGMGEWSEPVNVRTSATATSPPVLVQPAECSTSSSIRLQWEAPLHDNGSAVTSYHVEYATTRQNHTWHQGYSGRHARCQIEGLSPGKKYQFRVRAQNAHGQSPWSSTLQTSTAADVPEPPTHLICSKRQASGALAKWTAPEQDNGAAVFSYRLECTGPEEDAKVVYQGAAPQHKLHSLQAGTSYTLRVQAVNAIGSSFWSDDISFTTTRLPPLPPSQLQCAVEADPSRPSITISWEASLGASTIYAPVASYEVEMADQAESSSQRPQTGSSGKQLSYTATNLMPGTRYQVRVRCVGSEGSGHGTYSEPVSVSTPGNRKAASKAPSARSEASSAAGDPTSSGLAVASSGKARLRRETSGRSEDDLSAAAGVSAGPRRRKTADGKAVKLKDMRPEIMVIPLPKFIVRCSGGLVSKRGLVLGTVPPSLLPAYKSGQKLMLRLSKFWKEYWGALLVVLAIIAFAAYMWKYQPGVWREHPEVARRRHRLAQEGAPKGLGIFQL